MGKFRDDKFDGLGIFIWSDGQQYQGDFVDDERTGEGIMTWPDGRRYEARYPHNTREVILVFRSENVSD